MKNFLKKLLTVTHLNFFMLLVLALLVAYPLLAPIVPATYSKPIISNTTDLYAGHTITYKLHSCRNVSDGVLTTVTRSLVSLSDKTLTPISLSTDTFTNVARCQDVTKTLVIPYSTPAGTYQLVIKGVYSVIPLRNPITVTATSDSFVLKGATTTQDIQALIDANTQLEAQIRSQVQGDQTNTTPVSGSGSTTITATVPVTSQNTPTAQGSGSDTKDEGFLQGIIRSLGGGAINISL